MDPIPPNTAATKALIPGMEPVYGVREGYAEHNRTPATAASPDPMAKVSAMVPSTLIPISCAAPLSSDTANIACPALVLLIKSIRPAIMIRQVTIVTMVSPVILICPSASFTAGTDTTEVNALAFAPKIKRATFCSR